MSDAKVATASSSINLVKSLIDFVPASGSLIDVSRETYNWLVRERIDEGIFEKCSELAAGLAYPNAAGQDIQQKIARADKRILQAKQAPIRLVLSGGLGRLLASKPQTLYMVSTVAALTQFHAPEHVAEVLCSMMMDKGGHAEKVDYRYEVQRSPVRSVVSKIVDSIYLNVVNVGHSVQGLPVEFAGFHHHLLDDRTFAGLVMGIERTEDDVTIRSDRFLADLTLWMLTHFHGVIEISLKGKVIYEKRLGSVKRHMRMMIERRCDDEGREHCEEQAFPVEAMLSTGSHFQTFLKGRDEMGVAQ